MKLSNFDYRVGVALALAAAVVASPALAAAVLLGSDYLQTVPPSFFGVPKAYLNAGEMIQVKGWPIGPGTTDTIVQRQDNCILHFESQPADAGLSDDELHDPNRVGGAVAGRCFELESALSRGAGKRPGNEP